MRVASVVIIDDEDDVVIETCVLIADEKGSVISGKYIGQRIESAAEDLFYEQCRKIDSALPKKMPDEDELPENYPDFDMGVFHNEACTHTALLCWPTIV